MARDRSFFGFVGKDADIARRFAEGAVQNGANQKELGDFMWWAGAQYKRGNLTLEKLVLNASATFPQALKTLEAVALTFDQADELGWDEALPPGEASQADNVVAAPPPQGSRARAAEIEGVMKSTPDVYFADKGMQQEYAGLMGATAWSRETSTTETQANE